MSKRKQTRHRSPPDFEVRVSPEIRHKLNTLGAAKHASPSMFVQLIAHMYSMGVRHSFTEGQWLVLLDLACDPPKGNTMEGTVSYKINADTGQLLTDVCRVIQMPIDTFMLFSLHDGLHMFESIVTPNRHNLPPTIQTAVGKVQVPREN